MESLNEGELQQHEEMGTNGHAEGEVKTTCLKEDTSTKALSVEHANDESEAQALNERSVRQTDDASETTASGEEVISETEINLESKHQDGEINNVNSKNNCEETDDKNNDRNDEEEKQRVDETILENENVENNLNLDSSENILLDEKESGAELDIELVEDDADKKIGDKKEELKEYRINDENGNFDEISEDLLVFREKRSEHDLGDDDVYFSDRTESTNILETMENNAQEDLVETQMNEVTEIMQENLNVDGVHVASEKSNVKSVSESKNKHLEDSDVLGENKQNDDDDDEDGSHSTDTSTLANIIVKHVLDTAVSSFNNDTSFSSDDGVENDQELMSRESLTVKDEDKKQVKHSNERDDMTVDKEMYKLSDSESSITSKISTSEQCLLSGEEDSGGNEVEFDENGNRRTADQHFNPVAIEIAVAMVYDQKEATQNRVTDQIREDIQEISEHISLNDTVETEQNISKTIENDENRIHEILTSEEDVKEQEEQSVEVSSDFPCGSQGLQELPLDSLCCSQGLPELPPLPNYPDFPINYGNYKVCRNLSPSEKECLIIETGEMVTCKDKLNSKTSGKIGDEDNKMRKFKPPEDLSEIGKESKICTLSNAPQQTINNVSQDMIGSECTKSSSPHRNGESSFRIMKNEYDCKQSPVTSPRNDYEEKNFNRVQNVPANIDYEVDILPQSRYSEDNPEARIPRNQHFGEQDFKLNRSGENQQLNNESDVRGRIQQNVLQSSSPRNIHQTNGDIDLSNPSVMVRYQRNILTQNLHQNFAHASLPTDADHNARSFNTPRSHSADFSNQSKGTEADRPMVSPFYAKYGNSSQSRNMLGYPDDEREFSASSEAMSMPSKSGSVPSYRTLHEQQNTWMQMFKTLEEKHHLDLQQQNRLHKEALFNLQQSMEDELLDQQKSFRQKLTVHKEALSQSLNRSLSPINSVYDTKKISNSRMNDSHVSRCDDNFTHSNAQDGTLSYQETFQTHNSLLRNQSPSWREIYKEIRGTDASDEEQSPRESAVRRSLDKDLTTSPEKSRGRTDGEGQKEQNVKRQTVSPREQPSRFGHPDRPRAGVYSSPMPLLRGRGSNSQHVSQPMQAIPVNEDNNVNTCDKVTSPSLSGKSPSRQQQQQMLLQNDQREAELFGDSTASDDVHLSASSRVSLREKHAKHMADLREYYEKELRELKASLLLDITEESPFKQVSNENQNLVIENRLLREKIEDLENELTGFNRRIRELEQFNHGLEDKVKEYAENYGESQAKLSNFRNKMEELQYYFREKDETNQQLKYQVKHLSEKIRTSKKVSEKYEATQREHVMIKESLNSTENKLYDAQTEIVNLKRNTSKLELENKRLARENDNLHNKKLFISDMNSCMHDSSQSTLPEYLSSPPRNTPNKKPARSETTSQKDDLSKGDNPWIERDGLNSSVRDVSTHRSVPRTSAISHDESIDSRTHSNMDNSQMSPIVKAEQDLYMLRDMMRQRCHSPHSPSEPPKFKLKKKFYGSDIQTQTRNSEYSPVSSKKTQRRKSPSDSPKTKSIKSRKPETASNGHVTNTGTPNRGQRSSSNINVNQEEFSNPTRFGIDMENNRIPKRQSGDGESRAGSDQTSKKRSQPSNDQSSKVKSSSKPKKILNSNSYQKEDTRNGVEDTLHKVKAGEYVTRPEWENVFTSMTKPLEKQPLQSTGDKIRNRQSIITDLEQRYVELNAEKRKLESVLSRVPLHGKGRQEKERVEDTLDQVERELGSIRMSLKRYNALKTSI